MTFSIVLLALGWVVWCILHSLFITPRVTSFMQRFLGDAFRFYRLAYNVFSGISLLLLFYYQRGLPQVTIYKPEAGVLVILGVGILLSMYFFVAGARVYDNRHFLGLRQIAESVRNQSNPTPLRRTGILGTVRHPYYTGGIIFLIFYPSFTIASLVMRGILLVYLVVGTLLEERKLLAEYGQQYRDYMKDVPRFFPNLFRKSSP